MEKPDKYFKQIENKLSSGNKTEILKTLKEIRVSGKAVILPLIFQILDQNPNDEVAEEIFSILSQLKNKECVPYIIDAIKSDSANNYITRLITTCWQSGLDYSDHIVVFAEKFVRGDYQTAIEAFSVIEEWIFESDSATIANCKQYLISSIDSVSNEKRPLYFELVKVVESHI
jgi:hypothetical protein